MPDALAGLPPPPAAGGAAGGFCPTGAYPFFTFSAISFSYSFFAAASDENVFSVVCPLLPSLPYVVVNSLPASLISQNLLEEPSENSYRGMLAAYVTRTRAPERPRTRGRAPGELEAHRE